MSVRRRRQRFRGVRVDWRGYLIARVEDRELGEVIGVYRKLGKWRRYGTDDPVPAGAAAVARRMLKDADPEQVRQEVRSRCQH